MPFVTIETIKGILDDERKALLLDKITEVMVEIEGRGDPKFRASVWVKIDEQDPSHWSLGGVRPTAELIAAKFP